LQKSRLELLSDLEILFEKGLSIRKVHLVNDSDALAYPHVVSYFSTYKKPLILSELYAEYVEGENTSLVREVELLGHAVFAIE
jgi:hypothetical protein